MKHITTNLLDYFWKKGIKPTVDIVANLHKVATSGKYIDLTGTPAALKNPQALTFTGGVTGSYDGSAAKSVKVPSLTNNLLATAAGTALDAAQGKILKALHDKNVADIEAINSNLSPWLSHDRLVLNSNRECICFRCGCFAYLTINFGNIITPNNTIIGTLPVGYRPLKDCSFRNAFDNQLGEITITPSGVVKYESNEGSSDYVRGSITFLCDRT